MPRVYGPGLLGAGPIITGATGLLPETLMKGKEAFARSIDGQESGGTGRRPLMAAAVKP